MRRKGDSTIYIGASVCPCLNEGLNFIKFEGVVGGGVQFDVTITVLR